MIGRTVSHYEILEKFGEGGMGVVYKARDTRLDRLVVLKFLHAQTHGDDEFSSRFIYEAKAVAALNHPNICTIHEIDEHDGQPFIAMEFVEGQTVQDVIESAFMHAERVIEKGGLSLDDVLDYAIQIAEGLQAAHEKGIIHRDIKPANILVTRKGQIKIMDFGLAKVIGRTKLTQTGTTLGTLVYMSPEQLQGEIVDARADDWSFGAVLYEMVTGRVPFSADYEAALIYSILNRAPPAPSEFRDDLPTDLERIILRCLCKETKGRYRSTQQLLQELQKVRAILATPERRAAQPETKPAGKRESERRQATVLSLTIAGYNEMVQTLDPEEASAIISLCFKELRDIALKYQGTVDQMMANGITVLFGVPRAIENAPQQAIIAAHNMRSCVRQLNRNHRLHIPLDSQIGIDTGVVIVGAAGEEDEVLTFLGEPIVYANRLTANAVNGQILVGSRTHRHTRNDFEFKELPPASLKDEEDRPGVFELLSADRRPAPVPGGTERMIHSEMVGRVRELDKLKLQVLKVINGEGSIVNVIGEAGIGKSRLIAELRRLDDVTKVALHEGRALSIGKNLSYHPIIDIIKNRVGITEKVSEGEAQAKLERAIREVYPEGVDEIFPFLATLMGMKLSGKHAERVEGIEGQAMEKLILKNLRELMMKGAEQRPIVYILQDLHWADQTSLELLQSLYRLAESHPICFINVLRPNYPETGEKLLETIEQRYPKAHVKIVLDPLDNKQSDVLIQNLLKASGIPTTLRGTIAEKAEGNPFFIEEVVRSCIDDGALVFHNGQFKATEKIESVVIPETIQGVLMTRIDRLDEDAKSLLKHASVIGRYFFFKILAEVAKATTDIDERLDDLQDMQLILKSQRAEELEYLFKHALAQEVIYESILLKTRKDLHLRVAEAIESVFSKRLPEFYGMLALHYSQGENHEKAEVYLIKAGEEALKAAASNEALSYYQAALDIYLNKFGKAADSAKVAELEKNIGVALFNKGFMVEAVEHFDRVLECWGEKRARSVIVRFFDLVRTMFNITSHLYLPRRAKRRAPTPIENEMMSLIEKRGNALVTIDTKRMFLDSVSALRRLNSLDLSKTETAPEIVAGGSLLFALTGFSLKLSQKIMDSGRQLLDQSALDKSNFHYYKTTHDVVTGEWNNARLVKDELADRYLSRGELYAAGGALIWWGLECVETGDFTRVRKCLDGLMSIADTYDNDHALARYYVLKTRFMVRKRELSVALQTADLGSQFIRSRKLNQYALWVVGIKPYVQILLGDYHGARQSVALTDHDLENEKINLPAYLSGVFASKCLLHLFELDNSSHLVERESASSLRKSAYRSCRALVKNGSKYAPDRTEAFKLMGRYYWLISKQKKALMWWDKGIRIGEQLGARPELARTYLEVGKRLLEPASKQRELDGISGEGFLDKANALFETLDLQWDLDQLDNIRRI